MKLRRGKSLKSFEKKAFKLDIIEDSFEDLQGAYKVYRPIVEELVNSFNQFEDLIENYEDVLKQNDKTQIADKAIKFVMLMEGMLKNSKQLSEKLDKDIVLSKKMKIHSMGN